MALPILGAGSGDGRPRAGKFKDRLGGIPLLITHCREEEKIPFRMGERLRALAGNPKWFWALESCGHPQGFTDRFPVNRARLAAFVDSLPRPIERNDRGNGIPGANPVP